MVLSFTTIYYLISQSNSCLNICKQTNFFTEYSIHTSNFIFISRQCADFCTPNSRQRYFIYQQHYQYKATIMSLPTNPIIKDIKFISLVCAIVVKEITGCLLYAQQLMSCLIKSRLEMDKHWLQLLYCLLFCWLRREILIHLDLGSVQKVWIRHLWLFLYPPSPSWRKCDT